MAVFPLPGCREDVLQQLEQRATGCGLLSFMLSGRNDAGGCCAVYFLGYADGTDADRAGMLSMQL